MNYKQIKIKYLKFVCTYRKLVSADMNIVHNSTWGILNAKIKQKDEKAILAQAQENKIGWEF